MKQKIKLLLFIKIVEYMSSTWILRFNNHMINYNNYLEKNYIFSRTLCVRNCRLLENCKKRNNSNIMDLTDDMSQNGEYENRNIYYNEKGASTKNKRSNRNSLNNASEQKQITKNKSSIFETKKYSHLEKKIFKELVYMDFLKNSRTLNDRIYKNIIIKKYGLRIALPLLLFLFLLVVFIAELTLGLSGNESLLSYFGLKKQPLENLVKKEPWSKILIPLQALTSFWEHSDSLGPRATCELCKSMSEGVSDACILGRFFRFLICFVPLVILAVTFISWIMYYHKKTKKYEKIKFRKR
ncbi:hypothetical protein MKS88_000588 [Plasmodium brasilianum]|uniref:Uncharacterized protein n=1 Tax=Plasmodium brasilianum TaxID=5824 RepID=A0ACB9YFJ1_PLABR|nr:hypothetical protein MKS88_000588 [Plasmodium brasilianum]